MNDGRRSLTCARVVRGVVFLPIRIPVDRITIFSFRRNTALRWRWTCRFDTEPTLKVGEEVFSSLSWSCLRFAVEMKHAGSNHDFVTWLNTERGLSDLVDRVVFIQNLLIDGLHGEFPFESIVRPLRHYGPADWMYFRATVNGMSAVERLSSALRSQVAAMPAEPALERLRQGRPEPSTSRLLLRACQLAESGAHMEAVLVAFALLDALVQDSLARRMSDIGVAKDASDALLRNVTQARLATYLHPILKLCTGYSLKEEDTHLFDELHTVNRLRNDAIHNGAEVTRSAAQRTCLVVYDVVSYLQRAGLISDDLPRRPVFLPL